MLLKDELKAYDNTEDRLAGFKKAIILQFSNYRSEQYKYAKFELFQEGVEHPDLGLIQDDDYQFDNEEVSVHLVNEVIIELGLSDLKFGIQEKHNTDYECLTFSYRLDDLWHHLVELSDFDFFVSMVILLRKAESRKSIRELLAIVSNEIKRFEIKLPDKKNEKVFIAMSFDSSMIQLREAIHEVVRQFHLDPIFIDEKEHNNQIVPEMIMEIEQCVLIIADLTHHKHGVYYEAGYAHAKGKEVIFSCKDTDYEGRHFDISHINTIKWESPNDLKDKLHKRLEATLYKMENNQFDVATC
ncbi:nucleoside 2-deoxyribosyltransferase [Paenibacillus wynnii]|uniref:nucleoside 2-deoxyribosyltransferase n=1 Tax=Paenibacillus wynnii TaxID=268407 RepID=UPI0027928176|nr:nucleoside 2-deoxyribosyltransferase [Paenibacillus wynnii]MDQ0195833.1 nucleoside 2-deoxyribosyltransferase [Paenibacillus wynnii]